MKDFLKNEVSIGDNIFYSTTGRYPESRFGEVVRMSDKSIWIKVLKTNRPGFKQSDDEVIVRNDFVIVK